MTTTQMSLPAILTSLKEKIFATLFTGGSHTLGKKDIT